MKRLFVDTLLPLLAISGMLACSNSVPGYGPGAERSADASVEDPDTQDPEEEDPGDDIEDPADGAILLVTVTPSNLALEPGETAQAVATVTSEGEVVDSPVSWLSSNEAIAVVDSTGLIRAIGDGEVEITAEVGGQANASSASVMVMVSAAGECPDGTGNNGDSCADIYQGQDIWRCTISPSLNNATVSQVCRDQGSGPKWITFHVDPTNCCACEGTFSVDCCAANSGSTGCP